MKRFLSRPRLVWCASILLALAAALVAPEGQAASGKLQFDSGGLSRSAFVIEHERLKRGARVTLIILHGGSGSGMRTRRTLGLEDVIRSYGVVVVYPDAIKDVGTSPTGAASATRRWCGTSCAG